MIYQASALKFILLISSFLIINNNSVTAQITPDNTLGAESSRIVPNGNIDKIDGGALRSRNLFHSFKEFNISNGQRVYFNNPSGIENILTRVTGRNASNILGTLGVDGAANLFLINPNGIVFGENARLDVQGSFLGTTANGLQFGEQGTFSATNPQAPGLLTVNPSALFFNQLQANGGIINKSQAPAGINPNGDETTGLRVPDGKSLLFVGGDINLDGGSLRAYEGNIELTSVSAPGTIGLDIAGDSFRLNVPEDLERGDISLANGSNLSVFGAGGGEFIINARNLEISNSFIFAGIRENSENPDAQAGDVNINATGSIELKNDAGIENSVYNQGNAGDIFLQASNSVSLVDSIIANNIEAGGVGKGGNININSGSLSLTDGSEIQAILRDADVENNLPGGQGNVANININVRNAITIAGIKNGFSSDISNFVGIGAVGNAGDININTGSLSLTEGSEINARTLGQGNAGNITVNARQNISLDGSGDVTLIDGSNGTLFTRIISSVNPEAVGNAGDININTGNFSATNGAFISSSIGGKGDGGNITINALDRIIFDTSSFTASSVGVDAVGNGGDIRLTTGTLSLRNGGQLSTNVLSEGNAGNIFVEARNNAELDGVQPTERNGIFFNRISSIQSSLLTGGVGKGGNIQITTGLLSVTNGAQISANTDGQGDAGNITINARSRVNFDGFDADTGFLSEVSTTGGSNSVGNGGDIRITTGELLFKNGGRISSDNFGKGNSGNIFLDVGNTIIFDGVGSSPNLPSSARVTVFNGNAGNIEINTGSLFLTNSGRMDAGGLPEENSSDIANAGNIIINARDRIEFNGRNSGLFTASGRGVGKGGDIQVTTGSLSVTNNATLFATTSGQGNAGNININARDSVTFDRESFAATAVLSSGIGDGGNIDITTGSLFLDNSSFLQSFTDGQGNAGNININARDTVTFDRGSNANTEVFSNGIGNSGDIEITTGSLSLSNAGFLFAGTEGKGDAGKVKIDASDTISLSNSSRITSSVFPGGEGKGGAINIDTQTLTLTGGSQISAAVFRESGNLPGGKGEGGEININASESVTLSGIGPRGFASGIITLTERGADGDAGNITLNTGDFRVTDAGIVTAATSNNGNAGNITINANTFTALNGGQVVNTTQSSGNAGTITLNITDSVTFSGSDPNISDRLAAIEEQIASSGSPSRVSDFLIQEGSASGLFASTSADSTGNGGSIFIDPRIVNIENGAKVSVSSDGTGDAGDIDLQAGTLQLDNGFINAETASTKGGDITLNVSEKLVLLNGSQISTTAGTSQAGGNGGNISMNSPFIVAVPNEDSDITANAFEGRGGNVDIITQGIFGIQPRSQNTLQSDITASSETGIQGEISVTDPEINPTQGVIELPSGLVDKSDQVAQICRRGANAERLGEFYITGKGSLPPSPLSLLEGTVELSRLATLDEGREGRRGRGGRREQERESQEIVEARGFVKNADGEIYLAARVPKATSSFSSIKTACVQASQK